MAYVADNISAYSTIQPMNLVSKSYTCPRCGHRHCDGAFCHVFVLDDEESGSDDESSSGEESSEDELSDEDETTGETDPGAAGAMMGDLMQLGKKGVSAVVKGGKAIKRAAKSKMQSLMGEKLETPEWALGRFRRCNCDFGVPVGDKNFVPCPQERWAGLSQLKGYTGEPIRINQEGIEPEEGWKEFAESISPEEVGQKDEESDGYSVVYGPTMLYDCILPWLNARSLGRARRANKKWRDEVGRRAEYWHMNKLEELCVIEAHQGACATMVAHRGYLYTSGDRHVKVWDTRRPPQALVPGMSTILALDETTGEVVESVATEESVSASATRRGAAAAEDYSLLPPGFAELVAEQCPDTTDVLAAVEIDAYMYLASANGALRKYSMPHNPKTMAFRGQQWLHSKRVNAMAHWRYGPQSLFFTVSDDRTCRVWNVTDSTECIDVIEPVDYANGSLRSVAVGDHFLFLGSSTGRIYVYLTETACRRRDNHQCILPGGPFPFCLQKTLWHAYDYTMRTRRSGKDKMASEEAASSGSDDPGGGGSDEDADDSDAHGRNDYSGSSGTKKKRQKGKRGKDANGAEAADGDEKQNRGAKKAHPKPPQPPVVSALAVGSVNGYKPDELLVSGASDGSVVVWSIPFVGLANFCPLYRLWDAHPGASVTAITFLWAHLVVAGDDGKVQLLNLHCAHFDRKDRNGSYEALERTMTVEGRVRCLAVGISPPGNPSIDPFEDGGGNGAGCLYVGTNRGTVHVYRLGSFI